MKIMKVFDTVGKDADHIHPIMHKVCIEWGTGNDHHYEWRVGNSGMAEGETMTVAEEAIVDQWLREGGAVEGEQVLIKHWW